MTEIVIDPINRPEEAAHQVALELVRASGADLFRVKGVSEASGKNIAEFVIAFHKTLTEHYKTLG
ncbi:hypothetical protein K0P33_17125 [Pseudomonas sp. ArH3a]|uniref:hypothetical protein n=1 Tax=Pseudomonas TaxID=286 RepID=UPI001F5B00CE|nr:hypothetical protein [Pseudomonas sp. ArH3a]UNM17306.1 hypothetical protein K0P33_17125 [Pseudomonas sp. ArH3a]